MESSVQRRRFMRMVPVLKGEDVHDCVNGLAAIRRGRTRYLSEVGELLQNGMKHEPYVGSGRPQDAMSVTVFNQERQK